MAVVFLTIGLLLIVFAFLSLFSDVDEIISLVAFVDGILCILMIGLIYCGTSNETYTVHANVIGYGVMEDKTLFDIDGDTIVIDGLYEAGDYILEFDNTGTRDRSDEFVVKIFRSEK